MRIAETNQTLFTIFARMYLVLLAVMDTANRMIAFHVFVTGMSSSYGIMCSFDHFVWHQVYL